MIVTTGLRLADFPELANFYAAPPGHFPRRWSAFDDGNDPEEQAHFETNGELIKSI